MAQHILLVQNDAADAAVVSDALGGARDSSYRLEWVRDSAAAITRLRAFRDSRRQRAIAATVVDLSVWDSNDLDALDQLCAVDPRTPILVLCAATQEKLAKRALQRGAQDYLVKERIDEYSLSKALTGMIERAARAAILYEERERTQATLDAIGDAVISTDIGGRVTYLNAVAERLTGWTRPAAAGLPFEAVCCVLDAATRTRADNPMTAAIRENRTVELAPNCVLLARDGLESAIEDSAAPIRDREGRATGAVMVFRDVSAARAQAQRLAYLAQHDSLTKLPNRVLLNDRLTQALSLADRHHHQVAVLFLDIDGFKPINDTLGHDAGDRLLQLVADRLIASVRGSDTVGRLGGDEFVVVLSRIEHARDAAISVEKMLHAVARPYDIGSHEVRVTASIGIATYPADGSDPATLLTNADRAMYSAKAAGRSNYTFTRTVSLGRSSSRDARNPHRAAMAG